MGFIPRRRIIENLAQVDVFVNDTQNEYFKVQDLPDTFVQGRSAFKIFGSDFLKQGVPLKIEILDKEGDSVYVQPVKYGQAISPKLPYRYISVEVYPPPINVPGEAELVILGELDPTRVPFNIPQQFIGAYNVKYRKTINIDTSTVINTQPILFYKKPLVTATAMTIAQKKVDPPANTYISGSNIYGLVKTELKGKKFPTGSSVNRREETDEGGKSDTPAGDIKTETNLWKYKTGLYTKRAVLNRRGLAEERLSAEPPQMSIITPTAGTFNSKMIGGEITVTGIGLTSKQKRELSGYPGGGGGYGGVPQEEVNRMFAFPRYRARVENVISDKKIQTGKPYSADFTGLDHKKQKIYSDIGSPKLSDNLYATFTASYVDWNVPSTSSYRFDTFVDMDISNMRTFSGDIYRLKIYGASDSAQADFPVLLETIVESPELLVESDNLNYPLRSGYFQSQTHIDNYWDAYGGDNNSATLQQYYTMSLSDAVYLSGSYGDYKKVGRFELKTSKAFTVKKDVPYTLSFNAMAKKTEKTINSGGAVKSYAKILFHLSGSNLAGDSRLDITHSGSFGHTLTNEVNQKVGLEIKDTEVMGDIKEFPRVSHTFYPKFKLDTVKNEDTILQMRIEAGEWYISDVSLRPAQDTGFSPDDMKLRVPLPPNTMRPDNYDFLIEYYDINGNTADAITFIDNVGVSGSALVVEGSDNLLTGSLYIGNIQGQGIQIDGANSAFMRAVSYKGFISASQQGHGGFMIWSGSVLPDAPDNYAGAGLEIHDGDTATGSYFKFRTKDADAGGASTFDVKSSRFFFGSDNSGSINYVSGSGGKLEISSSNFVLEPDGDVIMQGTITAEAGGTIGGWDITSDAISDLNPSGKGIEIKSHASTPIITIKEDANNKLELYHTDGSDWGLIGKASGNNIFRLGSTNQIAGWSFTDEYISKELTGHTNTDTSRIYLSKTHNDTQNIGQGLTIYRDDDDTNAGDVKIVRIGQLSNTGNLRVTGSNDYGIQVIKNKTATTYENLVYIGKTQQQIAGWNITPSTIESSNLVIHNSGEIRTSDYDPQFSGWIITSKANGFAEFENMRIRGTLRTTTFEKETVNAVGGQVWIANSTVVTKSVASGDDEIVCENVSGFAVDEVIFAKKVSAQGFTKEFMKVTSMSREDSSSDTNFVGTLFVDRETNELSSSYTSSLTNLDGAINATQTELTIDDKAADLERSIIKIDFEYMKVTGSRGTTKIQVLRGADGSQKIAHSDNAVVGQLSRDAAMLASFLSPRETYTPGQVLVSTGRYISGSGANTTGSGYMLLNANPSTGDTPFMDFAERTGSGVYDVRLKTRLGDLSGLISSRFGREVGISPNPGFGLASENVFLSGMIRANSGSIGGITMGSEKIWTGGGGHGDTDTGFFASQSGDFSLSDAFVWTANPGTLVVSGSGVTFNSNTFDLNASTLELTSTGSGRLSLGTSPPTSVGTDGIFLSGSGHFSIQSASNAFMRLDEDGFQMTFPSFSVDTFGRMTATAGTFRGHLEASTGFIGSSSNDGWNISANTIADSDNKIVLDATKYSENITITSGSYFAELVPTFSDESTILSAGGKTYTGAPSAATMNTDSGLFSEGSSGNLDRDVEDLSTGEELSSALALFGGFSSDTTPSSSAVAVISTSAVGSSNEAILTGGTKVYRSSATVGVAIAVNANQYGSNSELYGNATIAGDLILYNGSDAVVATQAFSETLLIDLPLANTPKEKFTKSFSTTFTHTVVTDTTNYYIKASGVTVTNNGITEAWVVGPKTFTAATEITETALYFTSMAHQPSNKKVEIAPKGINAVFLSSATLESSANKYFRVAPEEGKTVDILGSTVVTGSIIIRELSATDQTTIGSDITTTGHISTDEYVTAGTYVYVGSTSDGFYHGDGIKVKVGGTNEEFLLGDNGHFHAEGDITAYSSTITSDIRLKENIKPLENNLNKILELKPSSFTWKVRDKQDDVGFIAQEIETTIPTVVQDTKSIGRTKEFLDGDTHKVVDYAKLSVYLVGAVQEQQKQIDELKQKLEEL